MTAQIFPSVILKTGAERPLLSTLIFESKYQVDLCQRENFQFKHCLVGLVVVNATVEQEVQGPISESYKVGFFHQILISSRPRFCVMFVKDELT